MFTVEVATVVMLLVTLYSIVNSSQGSFAYNIAVFIILFVTLLFANFAEAIAEARGKAQADSLRKTREETPAKKVEGNKIVTVSSSLLKKGDVFVCEAGDVIPSDGEIIEGLASIDESAITGESAPVIREAGGDKSSVTGGTKVLSDHIKVLVTTQPGESFLDKMIALVEGASRQKTPNEIALTILLAGFTLVFVIVCVTLKPFADYSHTVITIASLISLFVCLIPTTIGGLLSAIGIAGMDRALRANVITKSGKAVETAGDIDTLLLDKTGTITIGNRKATHFHTAPGVNLHDFVETCLLSSLSDETPEGKSIVELVREAKMVVVDQSDSYLSREFTRRVNATPDVRVVAVSTDMEEAKRMLDRKEAYGILYFPTEFSKNLHTGKQTTVPLYCDMSSLLFYKAFLLAATEVSLDLGKEIRMHNAPGASAKQEEITVNPIPYESVTLFNTQNGFASFLVPAILILVIQQTLVLGIGMLGGTAREKNRFHSLVPISRHFNGTLRIVLGKSLTYILIYVVVCIWVLAVVPKLFSLPQVGDPVTILLFILPYLFASIFFAMTLSGFMTTREAPMLVFVFTSVILLFISGVSWPKEAIPPFWQAIGYLFPSTPGIQGFIRINTCGAALNEVVHEYHTLWIQAGAYS